MCLLSRESKLAFLLLCSIQALCGSIQALCGFRLSWSHLLVKAIFTQSTAANGNLFLGQPGGHSRNDALPAIWASGLTSFRIDWFDLFAVQRDSQESSPAPQFESINSLVLSLVYGPTLTSVHDYWKNHSFEYIDFVGNVMSLFFNMFIFFIALL